MANWAWKLIRKTNQWSGSAKHWSGTKKVSFRMTEVGVWICCLGTFRHGGRQSYGISPPFQQYILYLWNCGSRAMYVEKSFITASFIQAAVRFLRYLRDINNSPGVAFPGHHIDFSLNLWAHRHTCDDYIGIRYVYHHLSTRKTSMLSMQK